MTRSVDGPPQPGSAAAGDQRAVIAADVGGTQTRVGLVVGGSVEHQWDARTPAADGSGAVVSTLLTGIGAMRKYASAAGLPVPEAVGIGSAGVIDTATGTVLAATDHITAWAGTRLGDRVGEATGLRTRVVNDVHAHALGEALYGAGAGHTSALVIAAGTGLGGAYVLDGRVLTGARYVAGHLGHVVVPEAGKASCSCGGVGHLETVSSGTGLLALYRSRGGAAESSRDIVTASEAGNALAIECLSLSGRALGRAIGGWINTLDPHVVIVTGGLAGAGQRWWSAMDAAVRAEAVPLARDCPVLPAACGPGGALLGAASLHLPSPAKPIRT